MNPAHLAALYQGVDTWNEWRSANANIRGDLSGADLRGRDLRNANFQNCNLTRIQAGGNYASPGSILLGCKFDDSDLTGANLRSAILRHSSFRRANLTAANITKADLYRVNFDDANMHQVDLWGSSLTDCDLRRSALTEARLRGTSVLRCNLRGSNLSGSIVYGCSAWDVDLRDSIQLDLIITPSAEQQAWRGTATIKSRESVITVDNLEIAQLIYLILRNDGIRDVIDTIGRKGVLLLGRFTSERKIILDGLRTSLRKLGYLPLLFDFERPSQRDFTETVRILAGLSRFIIADITNPKSSPLELQAVVPDYMIPLVPIIQEGERPFSMFADLQHRYADSVLDVLVYDSLDNLLLALEPGIIAPATARSDALMLKRAKSLVTRHVSEFVTR